MAFAVLSCSQLVHAFNVRSDKSLFEIGVFGNFKMIYSFFVCLAPSGFRHLRARLGGNF